jgi:hypothetical protein
MAETLSNMMPLGTTAPDFTLPDTISDESKNLTNLKGEQNRTGIKKLTKNVTIQLIFLTSIMDRFFSPSS